MARGPRKHLKRLFAPKDWMLSKLGGVFAPRPRTGPHKIRECMPLVLILRNRLKYALNAREAEMIVRQKLVKVDSRPRIDAKFPVGFQDVLELPKTGERYRMLYDVKGRFTLVKIGEAEAAIKLCKVTNVSTATGRVPVLTTHDGRRLRYPAPNIRIGDSVVLDHREGKITDVVKAKVGNQCMVTGGANRGRIGEVVGIDRHPGAFDVAHVRDANNNEFVTRFGNIFFIANSKDSVPITLPKAKGVKLDVVTEREQKLISAETRKQAHANAKKRGAARK
jgi:small subunit ribosomal protein S4e